MPDFLLVGAACCGAETLLDWLSQHPEIAASPIRETNYFVAKDLGTQGVLDTVFLSHPQRNADGTFQRADTARIVNRQDYERCFQTAHKPGALRVGEASPAYGLYPRAARRIAEALPHGKIVFLLRDPVERVLAHHAAFERAGREHLSLEEALEREEQRLSAGWAYHWAYAGLSRYPASVSRFLACFPLPQVHLVRAEDFSDAARGPAAWRALLGFLGVDASVPMPEAAVRKGLQLPPASAPAEVAARTCLDLAECLRTETRFYREVFSEVPFQRETLRDLARGGFRGEAGAIRQANRGGSVTHQPDHADGAVFQHLLLTGDPVRGPLYHRKLSHNPSACPRVDPEGGMRFLRDEVFSFDGFFNAFFESLVAEHTGMSSIQLRLEFTGRFFIEVFRLAQGRAPQLVTTVQSERRPGDAPFILELALSMANPLGSRLAFNLACLSKEGRFTGGSWWTTAVPRRAVQLNILACTHKKREFIERTVRRIADYARLPHTDYAITVVDNASELPADLFPDAHVRIVRQGNVGGAGGAARGILEGLAVRGRKRPTHFLLMDDDIELEPDMVLRAMSWLRHAKVDQCIGGGMLDLYRPTYLHELGATIGQPKVFSITPCLPGFELAPGGALDRLGKPPPPHYNAWWFVTISREAVEKHGLPLPCFIRGDDKEFGFRMLKRGVPTLSVPGIAVWHVPFYAKTSAWLYYFNTYNDLLICGLRFPHVTGDTLADAALRQIKTYLDRLEYDQAAMRVLGLEHFLLGPEWLLNTDCEARFREALLASKPFEAEHRQDVEPVNFNTHHWPKSLLDRSWRRLIHNGHLPLRWRKPRHTTGGLPHKVIRIHDWGWSDVTYFDEVGVKHALVPGIYVYRKRPEVYYDLLRRAKAGVAVLRREWPQRAAAFRDVDGELTSPAFWRRYLRLDPLGCGVVPAEVATVESEAPLIPELALG